MRATATRAYHTYFILSVSYDSKKKGVRTHDALIEKALGRKADSSGYNIPSGMRDVEFRFESASEVEKAREKVKKAGFASLIQEFERDTP